MSIRNQLMRYMSEKNIVEIKKLIDNGLNINSQEFNADKNTLLMLNVSWNDIELVKFFCDNGADINITNKKDQTALVLAAKHNNLEIIKYLYEKGARIDDKTLTSIGSILVEHQNVEVIKFFYKITNSYRIHKAATKIALAEGCVDLLKDLFEEEITYDKFPKILLQNMPNYSKHSKEIFEIISKKYSIKELLLKAFPEYGEDINVITVSLCYEFINYTNDYQDILLRKAIRCRCNFDVIKYIYEKTDPKQSVYIKRNLLIDVIEFNSKLNVIHFLCEKQYKINPENFKNSTALLSVVRHFECNVSVVRHFCERGININLQNKDGNTALIEAVKMINLDAVYYLCQIGCDVNIENMNGNNALIEALICSEGIEIIPDNKIYKQKLNRIVEILVRYNVSYMNNKLKIYKTPIVTDLINKKNDVTRCFRSCLNKYKIQISRDIVDHIMSFLVNDADNLISNSKKKNELFEQLIASPSVIERVRIFERNDNVYHLIIKGYYSLQTLEFIGLNENDDTIIHFYPYNNDEVYHIYELRYTNITELIEHLFSRFL